jgi:hypothetical protein
MDLYLWVRWLPRSLIIHHPLIMFGVPDNDPGLPVCCHQVVSSAPQRPPWPRSAFLRLGFGARHLPRAASKFSLPHAFHHLVRPPVSSLSFSTCASPVSPVSSLIYLTAMLSRGTHHYPCIALRQSNYLWLGFDASSPHASGVVGTGFKRPEMMLLSSRPMDRARNSVSACFILCQRLERVIGLFR